MFSFGVIHKYKPQSSIVNTIAHAASILLDPYTMKLKEYFLRD
jgi:hypothetical protein